MRCHRLLGTVVHGECRLNQIDRARAPARLTARPAGALAARDKRTTRRDSTGSDRISPLTSARWRSRERLQTRGLLPHWNWRSLRLPNCSAAHWTLVWRHARSGSVGAAGTAKACEWNAVTWCVLSLNNDRRNADGVKTLNHSVLSPWWFRRHHNGAPRDSEGLWESKRKSQASAASAQKNARATPAYQWPRAAPSPVRWTRLIRRLSLL